MKSGRKLNHCLQIAYCFSGENTTVEFIVLAGENPPPHFNTVLAFNSSRDGIIKPLRNILDTKNFEKLPSDLYTLQMKGRWESDINVWFPFMYSRKWNCALCSLLIFKTELQCSLSQFYTHISAKDLYISRISLSILLQPNIYSMWTAQFLFWEYTPKFDFGTVFKKYLSGKYNSIEIIILFHEVRHVWPRLFKFSTFWCITSSHF